MDNGLFHFINATIKHPVLDGLFAVFSNEDPIVIPLIVGVFAGLWLGNRRVRIALVALVLGSLVTDLTSEKILKRTIERDRPYASIDDVNLYRGDAWTVYDKEGYLFDPRKSYSMPSSHAANSACLAVGLAYLHPATLYVGAPFALLAAVSRVYTGNHYPSDVLAGLVWGGLCVCACYWLVRWLAGRMLAPERPRPPMPGEKKIFLGLLAAWTAFNYFYVLLGLHGLAGDEAQYWDWSRRLDWSYYSKPPLVAYVINVFTQLAGNEAWAMRSAAVLATSGTLCFVYGLTRRMTHGNDGAALYSAGILMATPLLWAGSVLITIDPLLALCWAAALYFMHGALRDEPIYWPLLGLALGLGLLAKFTMLFLFVSFALYLVVRRRELLERSGPYVAVAVAVASNLGVLYWNAVHDWVAFRHTANIGAAGEPAGIARRLGWFAEFFAGQAGVVSPVVFVLLLVGIGFAWRRARTDRDASLLLWSFGVIFVVYALVALTRQPYVNWPATAYLAAAPAFGWWWVQRPRGVLLKRTFAVGIAIGVGIGLVSRSMDAAYALGVPGVAKFDPTKKLYGGPEIGAALSEHVRGIPGDPFIVSDRYQVAAWAAFYTKGKPRTYCWHDGYRRANQYDVWGGWEELAGRDGIFVVDGDATRGALWVANLVGAGAFEDGEVLEEVEVTRGGVVVDVFTLCGLSGFSGVTPGVLVAAH